MKRLPLLPLRDIIVFPHMAVPLFVGREKSILALEAAMREGKQVLLTAQRRAKTNDPKPDELFEVGTIGTIIQLLRLPDGTVKLLVEGISRAKIQKFVKTDPMFLVEVEEFADQPAADEAVEALMGTFRTTFETYATLNKGVPVEVVSSLSKFEDPGRMADEIVNYLPLKLADRQLLLETFDASERLKKLLDLMQAEIEILQVERKIRTRIKKGSERSTPKDFYLDDPNQPGGREPGSEKDEFRNELSELEERIALKDQLSAEARERLDRELRKLKMMSPMSAEAAVLRNYIDWVLSLPWGEKTEEQVDVELAESILDADHFGLKKPKERILEFLAVHKLVKSMRGPILCMVGPPGVGKTSLARSIAACTGRNFVRISLGGVRDEADIRGHRRTYIGAFPGKIIQALKKAGSNNPVVLLDEIDKMTTDYRGDPSSAMLEVLDPEQNNNFNDHYLDLDYDLSDVMFITTANNASQIPAPLKDRMEIIEIPGYTEYEKLHIARNHLLARQIKEHGLSDVEIEFSDAALRSIIKLYTREAGVRNLEREVASVLRKLAKDYVAGGQTATRYNVTAKSVLNHLGPPRYQDDKTETTDVIGLTNGLAWTMYGGVLLTSEVTLMPGTGKLIITGKLGDVMQESAQAAMSYVRSRARNLGLAPNFYQKVDIHVHFPEGAAPKDGPSAGITMVTSIVSALTRIPVRRDVAMTGEITLRGRVLPIGGLKEKVLAAHRAGMTTVVYPADNTKDLRDIPRPVRRAIQMIPVSSMDEVLGVALALEDREAFTTRLAQPLLPPDLLASLAEEAAKEPADATKEPQQAQLPLSGPATH